MNKVSMCAYNRQSDHSPQEVVHAIEEVVKVSEKLVEINTQMNNLTGLANHFSLKAVGLARGKEWDNNMAVALYEACRFVELSSSQSTAIGSMFSEIRESIDRINGCIDKVLGELVVLEGETEEPVKYRWAEGTGRLNKAGRAINELNKMEEALSYLMGLVSSAKED